MDSRRRSPSTKTICWRFPYSLRSLSAHSLLHLPLIWPVLVRRRMFHKTFALLVASLIATGIAHLFRVIHFSTLISSDPVMGFSSRTSRLTKRFVVYQQVSQVLFVFTDAFIMLLLIMLAKGYTVTRRKVSAQGRVKIAIFGTVRVHPLCSPFCGTTLQRPIMAASCTSMRPPVVLSSLLFGSVRCSVPEMCASLDAVPENILPRS